MQSKKTRSGIDHPKTRRRSYEMMIERDSYIESPKLAETDKLQDDDSSNISTEKSQRCKRCCHCYKKPRHSTSFEEKPPTKENNENVCCILGCYLLVLLIIIGVVAGLIVTYSELYPKILISTQNITSSCFVDITAKSPKYSIVRYDKYGSEKMFYRYKNIGMTVSKSGLYLIECDKDNYPYFDGIGTIDLYTNNFTPMNISNNRLVNYHDGTIHRSVLNVPLQSIRYILVVSVIIASDIRLPILVTGPATVTFSSLR